MINFIQTQLMKNPFPLLSAIVFLLLSCKAMNKSSITESNIPKDIGTRGYKILFSEIDFEKKVANNVADIHNNAAEKYFKKAFKGEGEFIKLGEENSSKYSDTKVYRYVLRNRIGYEITKTYQYSGARTGTEKVKSHASSFYFVDRETGTEYPYVGSSTSALWMFKAIIDKTNAFF